MRMGRRWMSNNPLFLLLGPSGAGKSTIGTALAQSTGMLHIELDKWQSDGVDAAGLRIEWDAFYELKRPERIAFELARRAVAGGYKGTVATLPGLVILPVSLMKNAQKAGLSPVILYGSSADCLNAFLRREKTSTRGLDAAYWERNNTHTHVAHSRPEYEPYRVKAFSRGVHRTIKALLADVLSHAVA